MLLLPKELTQLQATKCLTDLGQDLRSVEGRDVVVDATELIRFDSAALAVLLEFRRQCLALGKQLRVYGLAPRLRDLAALYGVQDLLPSA